MFEKGQVVFSKKGRDKGLPFIVVDIQGEYLYLADGDLRLLIKPKKKKAMHVQPTNNILSDIRQKLERGAYLQEAELRKALKPYSERVSNKEASDVVER